MTYNLIIFENKYPTEYLNLSKKEFFDTLWLWTYVYDLWDFIEEEHPDKEYLENYLETFIQENVFHMYEEDEVDCFTFIIDDNGIAHKYNEEEDLLNYIYDRIKERYD